MKFEYIDETHEYRLNGRRIPSVTEILKEVIGLQWQAGEWHMDKGKVVHQCAALIARGVSFKNNDQRISGQVEACNKFFSDHKPEVISVEAQSYHPTYLYAGTSDLVCRMMGHIVVVDWKATIPDTVELQLAAYGLMQKPVVNYGAAVELRENGTYKIGGLYDLRKSMNSFLSCMTVYGLKQKFGRIDKKGESENGRP